MKLRWRLFFSHLLAIAAVVTVVSASVQRFAVRSISAHMGGIAQTMTEALESAVAEGVNEALIMGAVAGIAVAVIASLVFSTWVTTGVGQVAAAARRIAAGEYGHRVKYGTQDEMGELARSFNEMAARLEQTENVRRELLATISHELRTPLTSIQGYMEGLIDGVVPEDPATYQLVYREAARLSRLVADIERLSRVEAGVERIEPRRLDTARVAAEVSERLRPQFEQKPVSLAVEVEPGVPAVWADEDKLVQVLMNVLGNSFAYTPAGGHVTLQVGVEGTDTVSFEVVDDGVGISSESLPHIFERFYRADSSRSVLGGGAGIGLAVTKSLVEQMGGAISADSAPGEGTRVWFVLPAAVTEEGRAGS